MALLTPNKTYSMNGVAIKEKIIPDGTKWKDASKAASAGFAAGSLYKKQKKLTNNTGKVKYITIHNTDDLKNVNDDAEQYTRATYYENMGSARVHFYIDDLGAWQNLKAGTGLCSADPAGAAEVGWHAGDGSVADGGNMTSLGLEIIMGDTAARDAKAKDNGARVAAWLLWKHGLTIDKLVTHTFWVNKAAGRKFEDVDKQSTNPIYGKKWCPARIFGGTSQTTALKNWKAFKKLVDSYLKALKGASASAGTTSSSTASKTPASNSSAEIYRVRKSPNDAKSQIGAFKQLSGAKATADANPGYRVYNSSGKAVYPTADMVAREVIAGKWGAGAPRKTALINAGYNYSEVQAKVNAILK